MGGRLEGRMAGQGERAGWVGEVREQAGLGRAGWVGVYSHYVVALSQMYIRLTICIDYVLHSPCPIFYV